MGQKFRIVLFISLLMSLYGLKCTAQSIKVLDARTKEPIPYCTGQFKNETQGFVSDDHGHILFVGNLDGEITFRSIGYFSSTRTYSSLHDKDTIELRPSSLVLAMVTIRPTTPELLIKEALKSIPVNYASDSFMTFHYYQEHIQEDDAILHHAEAFIEAIQPPYQGGNDSAEIRIKAGKLSSKEALRFMEKERNKSTKKEVKHAAKQGKTLTDEELEWSLELGSPHLLLRIDPLRHRDVKLTINEDNVDFLDSNNFKDYEYWYGKPLHDGERSYTVIHFDQRQGVKKPMMKGTLWIDDASSAFVKISFGLSPHGLKHLLPNYMKAALWVYGLGFDVNKTLIEFEYRLRKGSWMLHAARLSADCTLERRRILSDNEISDFTYETEMITIRLEDRIHAFQSSQLYDYKKPLSKQLLPVDQGIWNDLLLMRRTYY